MTEVANNQLINIYLLYVYYWSGTESGQAFGKWNLSRGLEKV